MSNSHQPNDPTTQSPVGTLAQGHVGSPAQDPAGSPAQSPAGTSAQAPTTPAKPEADAVTLLTRRVAHQLHELQDKKAAADLVLQLTSNQASQTTSDKAADSVLITFRQFLLDAGRYADAATLLWPAATFSAEPSSVKLMWGTIDETSQLMVPGAASMGKSFSLGVWLYLDWLRDPEFTNVKVVGPSEDHLEKNLFSHLVNLHQTAAVPSPGECIRLGITLDKHKRDAGIYGVVVPIGKRAPAKLQGIKVKPRPKPHPKLGRMSRLRIMLEEAEDIPVGIWEDVSNILSNTDGVEQFKIFAAFNPKDQNGPCGVRCEPMDGWGVFDLDSSYRWKSRRGWDVVRLDGFRSENVLQGKMLYPGMQTKTGLERIIANAGGFNTRGYYTFARGAFPVDGAELVIIPQALLNNCQGEFQFVSSTVCAGVDIALEGADNAVMTVGRYGLATGWRMRPTKDHPEGQVVQFVSGDGRPVRRHVVQVDQQFKLPKAETVKMAGAIREVCERAGVDPEWLCVDRTVNGAGVHDYLKSTWGPVKGINPSFAATEMKILSEDTEPPCDLYERLVTELWYAMRKFFEHGLIKIAPTVPVERLFKELTTRQFNTSARGKIKVEAKTEYKSRGNPSPDYADSTSILLHGVRMNIAGPVGTADNTTADAGQPFRPRVDSTNRFQYLD